MNSQQPAFPDHENSNYQGLSKREYMATQILAGILAAGNKHDEGVDKAAYAVVMTNRLLKELDK